MKHVEAGGVRLSAIGLGTWQFGSGDWGYGAEYAEVTAPALVRRALELGVTLVDTAEAYGRGASERIVGAGLRSATGTAFVATKLTPILPIPSVVVGHAARSRERLGIDAIDLYQLHFPNPVVPLRTQAAGLRRALDLGIVRNVGVSNHSLGRWRALERELGRPVLSNQVELSLAHARALGDLVPYAAEHDRLVIAYMPLGQGILTSPAPPMPNAARRFRRLMGAPSWRRAAPLRAALAAVAATHGATNAQVALAWLIAQPNVVAIPGAHTVEQLEENVRAADLELTDEERDRLTEVATRFAAR